MTVALYDLDRDFTSIVLRRKVMSKSIILQDNHILALQWADSCGSEGVNTQLQLLARKCRI